MFLDPFLYLALGGGFALGRFVHRPNRWTPRFTIATVFVLIVLLGTLLGAAPLSAFIQTVPIAIGFALVTLALTVVVVLVLPRAPVSPAGESTSPGRSVPMGAVYLLALFIGFGAGRVGWNPAPSWLAYALYLLVALVGFDLELRAAPLRRLWVPLTATTLGAFGASALFIAVVGVPSRIALATAAGFGWYSLTGPVVTVAAGAAAGLLAFLANFLRENLTMVLSPWVGRRIRAEGLTALGGATAMDTTLFFVVRYGDREAASLAIASGLIFTLAASVLVPGFVG